MPTFMLTCVTAMWRLSKSAIPCNLSTRSNGHVNQNWCEASGCGNGVGWTPRPKVFWSSLVAPWRTVWRCKVEKNTAHVFRNKFPVNYRSSSKKHFNIPGNFKPILGNESVVSLWRKRHFFQNAQNAGAVFPPDGMYMYALVLKFIQI